MGTRERFLVAIYGPLQRIRPWSILRETEFCQHLNGYETDCPRAYREEYNLLPSDADAAGPWTTLQVALL